MEVSDDENEDFANLSCGEDVEFEEEKETDSLNSIISKENSFEVLSTDAIASHMTDFITDVNTLLLLPPTTVRILLSHFNWDKEKLLEKYYESDQQELFEQAGIIHPQSVRSQPFLFPSSETEDCEICFVQSTTDLMYGLECGHRFCVHCWSDYLTIKIMEEGMGQMISCAAHNCTILVDDAAVMKLVTDQTVQLKYQRHIANSFVNCNKLLRWCPSPGCTNAIRVEQRDEKPVTCSCGYKFCFLCGHAWHEPVTCFMLKKWLSKCQDDSASYNWIAANTKSCPKCGTTIEKNGGCNYMVCKSPSCKISFCWACLTIWESEHVPHSCKSFDSHEEINALNSVAKARAALERYLFYCNRYMNHMQSLKFEHKLSASVQEKMHEIQQQKMSWIEVQFLKNAVDTLCRCRQTLMYTYVFAFYLVKVNQLFIFEDNQNNLEAATEKLSEYLERDIDIECDDLVLMKQKVQDLYRYCESRRRVLVEHVVEGYEEDWWSYTD